MLRMASFPPDRQAITAWFADHPRQWLAGEAWRFAAELDGRMIGVVDIDSIADGSGTLGYWLDRDAWGRGYALEAAHAVVRFAFGEAGLSELRAGHAADNPASGRVLVKLCFTPLDRVRRFSRPRGQVIIHHRYRLTSSGT